VDATSKVIETDYDVLKERYNSITLGDAKSRLGETIQQKVNDTVTKKTEETVSFLEEAIDHATELITGGDGGYVVISRDADGKPYELLIMDNPDKTQAINVIRMNQNGIGFSTNGYNGPFTTAWTIDGGFVADFIKSGTIDAIDINGSNITGSIVNFGDTATKTIAEASNFIVDASETTEGVLFHGTGGFGVDAKVIEIDSGYGGARLTSSSDNYTEAHVNISASRQATGSNISRSESLTMHTFQGLRLSSSVTGASSGDKSATIRLLGEAGTIAMSSTDGITVSSDKTIAIESTDRTTIKSPSYVIVNSETWAYLGNYIANGGTYFAAGEGDNRVFIRTKGEGHYCKWATVNGVKCLVEDS
jgi:hypothetical protein